MKSHRGLPAKEHAEYEIDELPPLGASFHAIVSQTPRVEFLTPALQLEQRERRQSVDPLRDRCGPLVRLVPNRGIAGAVQPSGPELRLHWTHS
jgi:hypothetical protein